jgi:hypothetical protein
MREKRLPLGRRIGLPALNFVMYGCIEERDLILMVVAGWVVTVLWVLISVACFALGQAGLGEARLPGAFPAQRVLADLAEGRPVLAWLFGGMSIGMAVMTAICTIGLRILHRLVADLAALKADAHRDRQERQSDAAAMLERLPRHL